MNIKSTKPFTKIKEGHNSTDSYTTSALKCIHWPYVSQTTM